MIVWLHMDMNISYAGRTTDQDHIRWETIHWQCRCRAQWKRQLHSCPDRRDMRFLGSMMDRVATGMRNANVRCGCIMVTFAELACSTEIGKKVYTQLRTCKIAVMMTQIGRDLPRETCPTFTEREREKDVHPSTRHAQKGTHICTRTRTHTRARAHTHTHTHTYTHTHTRHTHTCTHNHTHTDRCRHTCSLCTPQVRQAYPNWWMVVRDRQMIVKVVWCVWCVCDWWCKMILMAVWCVSVCRAPAEVRLCVCVLILRDVCALLMSHFEFATLAFDCSVLQCAAVCYSVLQCAAVCCSVLWH